MNGGDRSVIARDQAATAFSASLMRLCDATGALGAALVDGQGETVDYAGRVDPFEVRIAAAECRLWLDRLQESRFVGLSRVDEVLVRAKCRSYAVIALRDGYAIVAALPRYCFRLSWRAVAEAVIELSEEAGLQAPRRFARSERWMRVEVRTEGSKFDRPSSLWRAGSWRNVSILGRYFPGEPGRKQGSLGFRARLDSGEEFNLVREPLGYWYVDELTAE